MKNPSRLADESRDNGRGQQSGEEEEERAFARGWGGLSFQLGASLEMCVEGPFCSCAKLFASLAEA